VVLSLAPVSLADLRSARPGQPDDIIEAERTYRRDGAQSVEMAPRWFTEEAPGKLRVVTYVTLNGEKELVFAEIASRILRNGNDDLLARLKDECLGADGRREDELAGVDVDVALVENAALHRQREWLTAARKTSLGRCADAARTRARAPAARATLTEVLSDRLRRVI
jgi:hypothetical protein